MKRSFSPPTRGALCALVAVMASGTACEPDNGVPPGPPVLTKMILVGPGPSPAVTITPETSDCVNGIASADACDPMMDGLCRDTAMAGWCSCVADAMDMTMGAWDCAPLPVIAVVAVFDRLLDTAPFDVVYPDGSVEVVTGSAAAGSPPFNLVTDYASTGTPMGVTPLFSFYFNGNFRNNGPSLFSMPDPGFPSGVAVEVKLQASLVRAKDGTTPFTGIGLLQGGTVLFTMPAFTASIAAPDAGNPASVTFSNFVGDDVLAHITVTADNVDITAQVDLAVSGGMTVTATPKTAWPAGATIAITVDATAKNALGQTIAAAKSDSFTAM